MRHYFAVAFAIMVLAVPWILTERPSLLVRVSNLIDTAYSNLALVVAHNPKTAEQIKQKYILASNIREPKSSIDSNLVTNPQMGETSDQKKVRILLVPGHEPDFGGTEFGVLKERNMNILLAKELASYLSTDPKYIIYTTRDDNGWVNDLSSYLKNSWDEIIEWQKAYREEFNDLIAIGDVELPKPTIHHNVAPQNVALRLYGINKWANENDIDIAIHIHFNDHPRRNYTREGIYSGFSIYVPTDQFKNSTSTKAIATKIFDRLAKYSAVSDMKGESAGIVDGSELIAIGANNTSDAPSMLIEYGYIYEPQFTNSLVRPIIIRDLAYQTYLGIQDFFETSKISPVIGRDAEYRVVGNSSYGTIFLPHFWLNEIPLNNYRSEYAQDIIAFQSAMKYEGLYPPGGMSNNDCPRTGQVGNCTRKALANFQERNGITDEKDVIGPKTLQILNNKYSVKILQ